MKKALAEIYETYIGYLVRLKVPFLFILRLYWGWQFFLSGRNSLMNVERTSLFFQRLSFPLPNLQAYLVGGVECFGGLFLLLGLGSQILILPLAFIIVMAHMAMHREELHAVFSHSDGLLGTTPFLFLFASLLLLIVAPGLFLLDTFIERWKSKKSSDK